MKVQVGFPPGTSPYNRDLPKLEQVSWKELHETTGQEGLFLLTRPGSPTHIVVNLKENVMKFD